jgi:glycosyltransferase involved in cell wall biosynthesis
MTSRTMKLAILTPYPAPGEDPRGGVEMAGSRLVAALEHRGVDVAVIGIRAGAASDPHPDQEPVGSLRSDERFSLVRRLRPMRKDLAELLQAAEVDIVHALGLVPAGFAATHVGRTTMPRVITAHGSRRQDTLAAYRGVAARARWLLGRRMVLSAVGRATVIIGVHPDWQVNVPTQPSRFVYIPNIVDERFFTLVRRPVDGRILYCGGDTAIKGWHLLRAAWPLVLASTPEARLQAIGCAPADVPPALRASVETIPWLAAPQLADAISQAAAVVIPSLFEVAPTVLSEAWAARAPVVATAVGGVPALATGAAHLVEELNPATLASALVRALEKPEPELVDEGAQRAGHHREDVVVDAHLAVYESLLAAR